MGRGSTPRPVRSTTNIKLTGELHRNSRCDKFRRSGYYVSPPPNLESCWYRSGERGRTIPSGTVSRVPLHSAKSYRENAQALAQCLAPARSAVTVLSAEIESLRERPVARHKEKPCPERGQLEQGFKVLRDRHSHRLAVLVPCV